MANENLMTTTDFNVQVTKWALKVKRASQQTLRSETNGTGHLANILAQFVDKMSTTQAAYKVKFQFDRYGVFRAYGAGRGYVIINGQIQKGHRVRSTRDIKNHVFGEAASRYLKKGYSIAEVNRLKVYEKDGGLIVRHPLDWIDVHITESIGTLADLVQEYYSDKALEKVLNELSKTTIVKNGKQ